MSSSTQSRVPITRIDDPFAGREHFYRRFPDLREMAEGAYVSPEAHGVEFDEDQRVIAMTLVNFKWLIESSGDSRP